MLLLSFFCQFRRFLTRLQSRKELWRERERCERERGEREREIDHWATLELESMFLDASPSRSMSSLLVTHIMEN